jgi:hypothetical protein
MLANTQECVEIIPHMLNCFNVTQGSELFSKHVNLNLTICIYE